MLLTWTLKNYGSFVDEATIDLQKRSFRRNVPKDGIWKNHVESTIAIYGPNASGKTTLLIALSMLRDAVRESTLNKYALRKLRNPHALHKDAPTSFEVDYVADSTRYRWTLTIDDQGVVEEVLRATDSGHWRLIFERHRDSLRFGAYADIPRAARENINELMLPHVLTMSAWEVTKTRGRYYSAAQWWQNRIYTKNVLSIIPSQHVIFDVWENPNWMSVSSEILKMSDTGINSVQIREENVPEEVAQKINKINKFFQGLMEDDSENPPDLSEEEKELVIRNLVFIHQHNSQTFELYENQESSGTRQWFELALYAVRVVITGGVLLVDELDASLHPQLANTFIQLFADPEINTSGAQLVFTTHDVTLMGSYGSASLDKSQIWLVEKTNSESAVRALDEFIIHKNHNIGKRYLQGAYGAVPIIVPHLQQSIEKIRSEYLDSTSTSGV